MVVPDIADETPRVPVIKVFSTIETTPVVFPPNVRVLLRRDWIVELFASSESPLLVEPASVAIGASLLIPVMANCALVVDVPPMSRSTVEFLGLREPLF